MATDPLIAFMSSIWLGLNCLLQRVTLLVSVISTTPCSQPITSALAARCSPRMAAGFDERLGAVATGVIAWHLVLCDSLVTT
jgi:hypothetical protein